MKRVGDRRYWEDWAKDVSTIADRHTTRIKALLADPDLDVADVFEQFLAGLRGNLNDGITRDNAIDMLAQHLITKPVFDALFQDYDFTDHNPVSQVMEGMLAALHDQNLTREQHGLDAFYDNVRARAEGVDNAEGKQKVIVELYEKFFKIAFPRAAESLASSTPRWRSSTSSCAACSTSCRPSSASRSTTRASMSSIRSPALGRSSSGCSRAASSAHRTCCASTSPPPGQG